jgi:hypothetical protein
MMDKKPIIMSAIESSDFSFMNKSYRILCEEFKAEVLRLLSAGCTLTGDSLLNHAADNLGNADERYCGIYICAHCGGLFHTDYSNAESADFCDLECESLESTPSQAEAEITELRQAVNGLIADGQKQAKRIRELEAEVHRLMTAGVDAAQGEAMKIDECEHWIAAHDRLEAENADLRAKFAAASAEAERLKQIANAEVDEFNAGHAAYQNGESIRDEPSGTKQDHWRVGYAFAAYDDLFAAFDDLSATFAKFAAAKAENARLLARLEDERGL